MKDRLTDDWFEHYGVELAPNPFPRKKRIPLSIMIVVAIVAFTIGAMIAVAT